MGAPAVYKSTDANAPVACATPASLINILDACLVDGYGDLPGAGWTKAFESDDGLGAVYKQAGESGQYVKIFAPSELPSLKYPQLLGKGIHGLALFEDMTDYETGLGQTPTTETTATFGMIPVSSRPMASSADNTSPVPWLLIADGTFFYLFIWGNSLDSTVPSKTAPCNALFAGDFIPFVTDESFCQVVSATVSVASGGYQYFFKEELNGMMGVSAADMDATSQTNSLKSSVSAATQIFVTRLSSGDPGCWPAYLAWGGGPINMIYDETKPLLVSRPYLEDGTPVGNLRGWLPGLYISNYEYPFDNWAEIEEEGFSFISVSSDSFHYLINIGEGFRP